ncbi:MAG: ABC transporter substrate-binding protein [Planctomycetes bacterium]|nr:ABC transporter substrate-binding protein [Planctomycetota bacterium]
MWNLSSLAATAALTVFGSLGLLLEAPRSEAPPVLREPTKLRLGYFANVTHATAIQGVEHGAFAAALGDQVTLETFTFNAGPAAVEALLSGALDASYIGPNPAVNAYVKSKGQAIRVIAGATSGGAFLVVDPSITSVEQLRGKKLATPQLGNTQDVALRAWLRSKGFNVQLAGESDVQVIPQENAQTLEQFRARNIAGAWVPEPWATRLILEGGGKVLVDERELWPEGRFVTTHLIVRTDYLQAHGDVVRALLRGHLRAERELIADPTAAQDVVNAGIAKVTGKRIGAATIQGAWKNLEFTHDPIAGSLFKSAKDAEAIGLLKLEGVDLSGIYELRPLNEVLAEAKLPSVSAEPKR